jgi:hypothetical protein
MSLLLAIAKHGPGDGTQPGRQAMYELSQNPAVVGLKELGGTLEVVLKDPAGKGAVDTWFEKNAGALQQELKFMAMMVVAPEGIL